MNDIKIVTDKDFDAEILAAEGPVLVSFTATWSQAGQNMAQTLKKIAAGNGGIKFAKIDVGGIDETLAGNDNPLTQDRFNIRIFPALLLFKKGKIAATMMGEADEKTLSNWLDESKNAPEEQAIPVEGFKDYIENYYRQLEQAMTQQAEKNSARITKAGRTLSMAFAVARATGGFLLTAVMPGPLTIIAGGIIMGTNGFDAFNTFKNKDRQPQGNPIKSRPLRMLFNFMSLASGAFLIQAAAAFGPVIAGAGLILGATILWSAITGIGRDFGAMMTTDLSKYPVERPQRKDEREPPPAPAQG